ncbi:MAG: hypothetical protein J6Z32_04220 [Bacteroidales bacterium]|nr:hypothetical protein [Bacteroidales bacterium]
MAIIVDTNCFSRVFCGNNKEHSEFKPVLDWILNGSGFLVYGGKKYKRELQKAGKFIKFFLLLKDYKKAIPYSDEQIDFYQSIFEAKIKDKDFDDPHLPAIVVVSKCRLICTKDTRSQHIVTSPTIYPKKFHVPRYYTGLKDIGLLNDTNIDKRLLKNKHHLSKKERDHINSFFELI